MQIRELTARADIEQIYGLVHQRQVDMNVSEFNALLDEMLPAGYRCIAAFNDAGEMVGVSGFWIKAQFYCRKSIRVDNFIIDEGHRNQGIGAAMLAWLEEEGKRHGCRVALLDSYVSNHNSHKFYFREGFKILGFHFVKEI
jgi:GNAT superfamily N-acetyltransferase